MVEFLDMSRYFIYKNENIYNHVLFISNFLCNIGCEDYHSALNASSASEKS